MISNTGRPDSSEFPPYAQKYVDFVPGDDPVAVLVSQGEITRTLIEALGDERAGTFRYSDGKWTAKEVVGHLTDAERIFTYRALRIARGDSTPLRSFEQNDYVIAACANSRPLRDLLSEWTHVRAATIALFRGFPNGAWKSVGIVNERNQTVRGIAFTMAGHEIHHFRILQEKYSAAA